ncbi:hypothetical protein [Labilibaculum antarcticum]|uniref:hypothetical protein n=1 Tax=Labilibaculum antarcticum TaxID=1717717 RepID=UPI0011AB4C84|nr:hypothetical protein [Labilibaculum antarcticum]
MQKNQASRKLCGIPINPISPNRARSATPALKDKTISKQMLYPQSTLRTSRRTQRKTRPLFPFGISLLRETTEPEGLEHHSLG